MDIEATESLPLRLVRDAMCNHNRKSEDQWNSVECLGWLIIWDLVSCGRTSMKFWDQPESGWWFLATPLKNMKVSWDDEIPNIWENKIDGNQTTNQWIKVNTRNDHSCLVTNRLTTTDDCDILIHNGSSHGTVPWQWWTLNYEVVPH